MVVEPKIVEIGQEMTELLLRSVGDIHDVTYATSSTQCFNSSFTGGRRKAHPEKPPKFVTWLLAAALKVLEGHSEGPTSVTARITYVRIGIQVPSEPLGGFFSGWAFLRRRLGEKIRPGLAASNTQCFYIHRTFYKVQQCTYSYILQHIIFLRLPKN
jgi:hypothetical protein